MQARVTPDEKAARRFHAAMRDIRRISGKDFETVMKHELGAMLSGAVKRTKKASTRSIKKNWDRQPGSQYGFEYQGPQSRKGKTYTQTEIATANKRAAERRAAGKNGKLVYYFGSSKEPKLYPNALWAKIKEQRLKSFSRRLNSRGLAASMFVRIGERLGIAVEAPGYVKTAKHHKRGNMSEYVDVVSRGSGDTYEVGFVNNLTKLNRWAQAGIAFRQSIAARATYFSRAIKLKAEQKIKGVLERYPGLASMS